MLRKSLLLSFVCKKNTAIRKPDRRMLADKNYYTYQEEIEDMITYQEEVYKEPNLCYGNLVKKAIDVFGSDYVEVE